MRKQVTVMDLKQLVRKNTVQFVRQKSIDVLLIALVCHSDHKAYPVYISALMSMMAIGNSLNLSIAVNC
jgi:hypothetical protein